MKAVIIAAGMGSRLWGTSHMTPKTLLQFNDGTILSAIIGILKSIDVRNICIVTGFKANHIIEYLKLNKNFGMSITAINNPDWKRGNGISVAAAESFVGNESFILSMSDHLVSRDAIKKIIHHQAATNMLLVDPRINEIFDIDDATKVQVENDYIREIGKDLPSYNAIDCGIFKLNKRFFEAMKIQIEAGKESISAGVQKLIESNDIKAVEMDTEHYWIDLDTPASYFYGLENAEKYLG